MLSLEVHWKILKWANWFIKILEILNFKVMIWYLANILYNLNNIIKYIIKKKKEEEENH